MGIVAGPVLLIQLLAVRESGRYTRAHVGV